MSLKPWFKFWDEWLDDPKVQMLPDQVIVDHLRALCLESRGLLEQYEVGAVDLGALAFALRIPEGEVTSMFVRLRKHKLMDGTRVHNWHLRQRNPNAEKQKRYRDRKKGVTSDVTDAVTDAVTGYPTSDREEKRGEESRSEEDQKRPKKRVGLKKSAQEILGYWNETHGRNISAITKILARLKHGATVEDCKLVIDFKTGEWTGTKFQQHLVPDTLFAPTKFEGYLSAAKEGTVRNERTPTRIPKGIDL